MTTDSRNPDLLSRATAAKAQLCAAMAELITIADTIRDDLSTAVEAPVKPALNPPQTREEAFAAHRRAHRSGYPRKIEGDPELEAFIVARIDVLTFEQITDAIKANFPPERHVGRSTVHRWWRLRTARGEGLNRL